MLVYKGAQTEAKIQKDEKKKAWGFQRPPSSLLVKQKLSRRFPSSVGAMEPVVFPYCAQCFA